MVWTNNVLMDAMTDILYDVQMDGDLLRSHAGNLLHVSHHCYWGFSRVFHQTVMR